MKRSSDCDVWKKKKEVMKIKVTQRLTYPEAKKGLGAATTRIHLFKSSFIYSEET